MKKLLEEFVNDDAISIASIIYDINQIMKNCKKNCSYSANDGVFYAYKNSVEDLILSHQIVDYTVKNNRMKKKFDEYIDSINGYISNGKELYSFIKNYKKDITKVELYNDSFSIYTRNKSIKYVSDTLDNVKNNDMVLIREYEKRIEDKKTCNKPIFVNERFEKVLNEINIDKIIIPYTYVFKTKDIDIKLRITKRLIQNYKKSSRCSFYIYEVDKKNSIYEIVYLISDNNSRIKNYLTIVNY